jgi:hypothetical protein
VAKSKLTAGAELDLLTAGEVRDVLKSWSTELTRGARMRRWSMQGNADGAGNLIIGDQRDGPEEGMVWAINRLSVAPGPVLGANGLQVYVNSEQSPSAIIIAKLVTDLFPADHGDVLVAGDVLRIGGAGITANAQVTVTLGIKEVPALMAWSL